MAIFSFSSMPHFVPNAAGAYLIMQVVRKHVAIWLVQAMLKLFLLPDLSQGNTNCA
jgi:hypothetical protein